MQGKNQAFLEMEEESSAVAMVNYFTNCAAQLRDRSGRIRHVSFYHLDLDSDFSMDRIRTQFFDNGNGTNLQKENLHFFAFYWYCFFSHLLQAAK